MAITYDTLGSTVTVYPVGAVPPSALNTSVAIVGGYDSANADGSVTEGEATTVSSGTDAENLFGVDCELTYQTKLALSNGATEVHGVPLPETSTTETFGSSTATASGSLSNAPAMDPRLHPDHDITGQDVGEGVAVTINLVDGAPSSPTDSNTINLNPDTGAWEADETSQYDITYTYGDFQTAIVAAIDQSPRNVAVCSENDGVASTAQTEASTAANDFNLTRMVVGSEPSLASGDISSYTPAVEDWRVVEVAPSRGTTTNGFTRTVGVISGLLAAQPINVRGSITYDTISGFSSYHNEYAASSAGDFTQVTGITRNDEIAVGYTTSAESAFRDIYVVEIIDLIVEQLHVRTKNFAGGPNTVNSRRLLRSSLRRSLAAQSAPNAQPPLLATGEGTQAYDVQVSKGSADTETDVNVGIQPAPIAKEVTLDISVGPFQFTGANV